MKKLKVVIMEDEVEDVLNAVEEIADGFEQDEVLCGRAKRMRRFVARVRREQ